MNNPISRRELVAGGLGMGAWGAAEGGATGATSESGSPVCSTTPAGEHAGKLLVSGILPDLSVSAGLRGPRSESGIGALMPWADRLWFITYTAHKSDTGSGTGLFYVDSSMRRHQHAASVVGTYANRFVHAPTEQMIIGPHVIDADNRVRTIEALVDYRLTATMTHLQDPANKVYVLGMESEFWEVDLRTLKATLLFTLNKNLNLPAGFKPHYKGGFSTRDRVIVGNNTYHERDAVEGTSSGGRLAEWDGKGDWRIVESTAFCDIAGTPMGDHANALAIGWDRASVLLNVLARGKWMRYRLPKASQCFDQAWYTEWPRIREVETERFLMDMHGLFYEVPRLAYGGRYFGLKPICQHLRIVPDFCSWKGMLVLAGNENTAVTGNAHLTGEPQSNLWFGKSDDLWGFGPPAGWGGPWYDTPVKAGEPSDPFLMTGFLNKCLHVCTDQPTMVTIEVDFLGDGRFRPYHRMPTGGGNYAPHAFPPGFGAHWARLQVETDCTASAQFVYS